MGLPKKFRSDAGITFVSELFKELNINIDQVVRSLYHHQSNGWVEACIKFVKHASGNADRLIIMLTLLYFR